jgi:hypothetical protein
LEVEWLESGKPRKCWNVDKTRTRESALKLLNRIVGLLPWFT